MSMYEYAGSQELIETATGEVGWNEVTSERSFTVKRSAGLRKKEEWTVTLTDDSVRFSLHKENEGFIISKDEANAHIEFAKTNLFGQGNTINVKQGGQLYVFTLDNIGKDGLCAWLPKKTTTQMKDELRKWGIGLIILGAVHLIISGFLDPVWGVLIAGIGVLNLLIPKRGMFIVNGMVILLAGVMNMTAGGGWKVFAMLQIIWGIQEIRKFREYA